MSHKPLKPCENHILHGNVHTRMGGGSLSLQGVWEHGAERAARGCAPSSSLYLFCLLKGTTINAGSHGDNTLAPGYRSPS